MGRSNRRPKEMVYEETPEDRVSKYKRTGVPMGKVKRERAAAKPRKDLELALKKAFSPFKKKEGEISVGDVERMQEILTGHKSLKASFASFAVVPDCEEELGAIVKKLVPGGPLAKTQKHREALLTALRATVGEPYWKKIDGATLLEHAKVKFIPPDKKLWETHFL